MNTIHYYPKASEKNAQTSPCPNCHFLTDVDVDDDGEHLAVFYECTLTRVSEEKKATFCEANKRLNDRRAELETMKQEFARLHQEVSDLLSECECDDEGDDGQPDEAKEWEDFGEVQRDGDEF